MRNLSGCKASSLEIDEDGNVKDNTPTGRSEMEDKRLLRQAILKEIGKVVEQHAEGVQNQTSMNPKDD